MQKFQISEQTKNLIELALAEDIGAGDCTSNAIIPPDAQGIFAFTVREEMVICGVEILEYVIANAYISKGEAIQKDRLPRSQSSLAMTKFFSDGEQLKAGDIIAKISGNVRQILRLERVTLNFLQHLSGIATLTNKYVEEISHTSAKLFDTRKTTPAFRELEKYAVRCGGGQNHRMRLDDMILIKDNHIIAAGGIAAAVEKARVYAQNRHPEFISGTHDKMLNQVQRDRDIQIMLEVDNLSQLSQAIAAQPDIIMLDNFSLADLKTAVEITAGKIPLEASGGVNLQTARAIAETGVDRISTSKITQSAPAVDIGLDEI